LGLRKEDFMHNFQRGVYYSEFYKETNQFLRNEKIDSNTKRFDDSVESLVEVWRKKAEKRYLKLAAENRLSNDDLFYSDLIGLSFDESLKKYNYVVKEKYTCKSNASDTVFNVFISKCYTSNAKPNIFGVKTKVKSNEKVYFSQLNSYMIEAMYFKSFIRK
jgi:hypothetical protein